MAPKLLLIGWSNADWRWLHPLIDAGELPALARIVNGGVSGSLLADPPLLAPMLWTTAVTGKRPDGHRVLQSQEVDALTGRSRPPSSTSRNCRAVWDILSDAALRTHVIGWPVTHPAMHVSGVMVSDQFARPTAAPGDPWPARPRSVFPQEVEAALLELRVHPGDLRGEDLLPFVPGLREIDQDRDRRLIPLAVALAEVVTVHAAATWALELRAWDFAAVHYSFSGAVAPEYRRVASRLHDAMLARLMQIAGEDTRVMVVSESGFAAEPSPHGMVAIHGAGVRADELVHGARLVDIVPTILAAFDLPAAEDMPGRVLREAFVEIAERDRIPTYEIENTGEVSVGAGSMEMLAELGYADPLGEELRARMAHSEQSRELNLALVHLAAGRPDLAIGPLEAALKLAPAGSAAETVRLYLCWSYLESGRLADCEAGLPDNASDPRNRVYLNLLRGRLLLLQGRIGAALGHLERARGDADSPALECILGDVYRASNRVLDAELCYRSALTKDPDLVPALVGLAAALLATHQDQAAMDAALSATGLDYGCAPAHYLLGISLLRLRRKEAATAALEVCFKLRPELQRLHAAR